jgi:hypothetical protein
MPVRTDKGFTGDKSRKVSLFRACEEVGVNLVTLRTAESGKLKDIPVPSWVGDGLEPGIPRLL